MFTSVQNVAEAIKHELGGDAARHLLHPLLEGIVEIAADCGLFSEVLALRPLSLAAKV